MTFNFIWIDFWPTNFGFGIFSVETANLFRNLFSIYWSDGDLLVDLFYIRVVGR